MAFPVNLDPTALLKVFISGAAGGTGTATAAGIAYPFTVTPGTVTEVDLPSSVAVTAADGVESLGVEVTLQAEHFQLGSDSFGAGHLR